MKANTLCLAVVGVLATVALVGCGGGEKVHAVDKVEEAQAMAVAKAPKADAVKFNDHGEAPMGGVGENGSSTATQAASAVQTAETLTTAHHGEASSAQVAPETASASEPSSASTSN